VCAITGGAHDGDDLSDLGRIGGLLAERAERRRSAG
jgi:hypothetical protein